MSEIFGSKVFFDADDTLKLFARLALDLGFAFVVIHLVYYRIYRRRDYVFTYFLFNIITFSLCLLLRKVPIELGFALGLFAVFGILRYRTEPIQIRDLTYLFIVIGIGILNALANKKISAVELLSVNGVIVGATAVLELRPGRRGTQFSSPILYDRIELLRPGKEDELYEDLGHRLGVHIRRVEVLRIDLLRDSAEIVAHYD